MRKLVLGLTVALALVAATREAVAIDYPTRPIHLIVPFEPGAGADILARVVGAK